MAMWYILFGNSFQAVFRALHVDAFRRCLGHTLVLLLSGLENIQHSKNFFCIVVRTLNVRSALLTNF